MDSTEALLWDKSRRKRDFDHDNEVNDEGIPKKYTRDGANSTADSKEDIKESVSKEYKSGSKILLPNLKEESDSTDTTEASIELTKEQLISDVDNERNFSNEEIHSKLKAIDPAMAARLHPNNRRKVLRSIEVWLKSGRRHSEILAEQKLSEGELRRPGSTIIFWLKCEQTVHDKRLDARVDSMLEEGLIQELLDFHDRHNKQRIQDGQPPDYTKGIFQTLGFKEFHEYLIMTEEQRSSEEGKKLLLQSIENMKMATRRYARRQNKMTRGRFLEHPLRQIPPIYELDTTELSKWDENVKNKCVSIIRSYLENSKCEYESLKVIIDEEKKQIDGNSRNYCDICERLIIGDRTYKIHLNSNKHKKVMKLKNKVMDNSKVEA